jgi:hypothetical protein
MIFREAILLIRSDCYLKANILTSIVNTSRQHSKYFCATRETTLVSQRQRPLILHRYLEVVLQVLTMYSCDNISISTTNSSLIESIRAGIRMEVCGLHIGYHR